MLANHSKRYADQLLERCHDFGDALYYYARSHQIEKLRNLAELLTKLCVIQSRAFPRAADVDETLRAMIDSPGKTVAQLDRVDRRAAELLSLHVSGYGTLRKFYDVRDEEHTSSPPYDRAPPSTRKEAAAAALVAAIASAADSIHGGLHDSSVDSVIQVDVLLVLLGEALAVVNRKYPCSLDNLKLVLMSTRTTTHLEDGPNFHRAQGSRGSINGVG